VAEVTPARVAGGPSTWDHASVAPAAASPLTTAVRLIASAGACTVWFGPSSTHNAPVVASTSGPPSTSLAPPPPHPTSASTTASRLPQRRSVIPTSWREGSRAAGAQAGAGPTTFPEGARGYAG
jgi:hypothetical protein